jgi:hypothetical protein
MEGQTVKVAFTGTVRRFSQSVKVMNAAKFESNLLM